MNKWLIVLPCLFFIAQHTFAQQTPFESNVSNVGTTAAAFLNIGVGSRANAMGGAFVAISDDATALYWNPAGMSQCAHPEITLNHSDWFLDIYHEFVGAVMPAGRHSVVWDAGNFATGVYLLKMHDEGGRMGGVRKVVLVK